MPRATTPKTGAPKTDAKPAAKKPGTAARRTPGAGKAKAANAAAPMAEGGEVKAAPVLRLKELIEKVTAATGGKKKGVKDIVDAVLIEMGAALDRGDAMNLPGFGKVRVARQAAAESGGAMTVKIRRSGATAGGAKAKAKDDKDDLDQPDE